MFRELDIRSTALHSNMSQSERMASIAKFKSNIVPILITTDVGSRGLDIPTVELVINYDVPSDARDYIHRIGRTARAGRGGLALTVMCEMDIDLVLSIEKLLEKKLIDFQIPDIDNDQDFVDATTAAALVKDEQKLPKELAPEKNVLALLTEVSTAKRVASMGLSESLSQSKKQINKMKVKRAKLSK